MVEEKTRFGEQAINKIAEVALARQLKDVEHIQVRVKTDLNKLARGEVESIAIALQNLLMHQNLRVEMLQLQIGLVAVKPLSALRGKIQLTQPSKGSLNIVINQDALTDAFNCATFRERFRQRLSTAEENAIKLGQVQCSLLSEDSIAFSIVMPNDTEAVNLVAFSATPAISADGQAVDLQISRSQDKELPLELIGALVDQVSEVLNLREFARQGMFLQIQQLGVAAGKLTLQAAARIEQFPSS